MWCHKVTDCSEPVLLHTRYSLNNLYEDILVQEESNHIPTLSTDSGESWYILWVQVSCVAYLKSYLKLDRLIMI